MRTFVMGDPHGGHKAMVQCFKRSKFNKDEDTLIVLGDVADGWPEVPECIEELMGIKNLFYILGNHDRWLWDWFEFGRAPIIWTEQGGQASIDAYVKRRPDLLADQKHKDFFKDNSIYYLEDEEEGRVFVHGGFDPKKSLKEQTERYLTWDRDMFGSARWNKTVFPEFKEIFLGHTTTERFSKFPIKMGNVWMMDQGGGWGGYLSIMDVDTKDYWRSDRVKDLYPGVRGR